jgi:hypothetical protein
MAHCGIDGQDQYPTLTVQLHGRGEDALRMEKRLHCAGRALGVNVRVERETGDFGEARVTVANHLLAERLMSTSGFTPAWRINASTLREVPQAGLR